MNRDLPHGEAMHAGQGGEKPVHPFKQGQLLDDGPPKDFQRAAGVMHSIARDGIADPIRDSGREPLDKGVVPITPPSAYKIIGLRERQESENVGRIELQITIHGGDQFSPGVPETGVECGGLSKIMAEMKDAHLGMILGELVEEAAAAIIAAIIDVDDFKRGNLAAQSLERLSG